jgi:hypothetical protein
LQDVRGPGDPLANDVEDGRRQEGEGKAAGFRDREDVEEARLDVERLMQVLVLPEKEEREE